MQNNLSLSTNSVKLFIIYITKNNETMTLSLK